MFNKTSSFNGSVPKNLWSEMSTEFVKVIIKGTCAEKLQNEILQRESKNISIILDDSGINISIIE